MAAPTSSSAYAVAEPFPIFQLAHRFLLYDPDTIAHVRAKYNIGGVLIGGLPQAPQQNVFLGIPLELMPEEVRVLVEKGVAFIQDDVKAHKDGFLPRSETLTNANSHGLSQDERRAYQAALRGQGQAAANQANQKTEDRRKAALSKLNASSSDWNDIPDDMLRPSSNAASRSSSRAPKRRNRTDPQLAPPPANGNATPADDELLFASSSGPTPDLPDAARRPSNSGSVAGPPPYAITPTTSYPPLKTQNLPPPPPTRSTREAHSFEAEHGLALPAASSSYPLFRHLHNRGYFMAPGLRFGCQYVAYPGDPLRFHSHFLCDGLDWDEEFDLLSLVGGGRLGTGVKKGFLIGGEPTDDHTKADDDADNDAEEVRTFCIEWGGM